MSESGTVEDPLAGWDPRRRASLERLWERFRDAAGEVRLSNELVAERRLEAAAADRADLRDEAVNQGGFDPSSRDGGPRSEGLSWKPLHCLALGTRSPGGGVGAP